MNETAMTEWLTKAYHDITSAKILYEANHYTDSIAVDLHYAVEKILKSFLAYENKKIPKTHDLVEVYKRIDKKYKEKLEFYDEDLDMLENISEYHIEESYPPFENSLPPREEMREVLEFSQCLLDKTCKILNVDKESLK
jgi:HEPN domain-containing protein